MSKKVFLLFLTFFILIFSQGFTQSNATKNFADSVYQKMNWEERIGQLFVCPIYSYDKKQLESTLKRIKKHHIAGVVFMQGEAANQIDFSNAMQKNSTLPLFIAQEAEWGPGMRLPETFSFPKNRTLGAIQNDTLLIKVGEAIGSQLKALGVNMNLAPVANPISNSNQLNRDARSFGESNKQNVKKAIALAKGLQNSKVIPVFKYFPSAHAPNKDTPNNLPIVEENRSALYQSQLLPFTAAIKYNFPAIMTGHVSVPTLTEGALTPVTLSKKITTTFLKDSLGFKGIVLTDALNKTTLQLFGQDGTLELNAFLAGHNLLLFPNDLEKAIAKIKASLSKKRNKRLLEMLVKQNIMLKKQFGLFTSASIYKDNIALKMQKPEYDVLKKQVFESAATLHLEKNNAIPFSNLDTLNIVQLLRPDFDNSVRQLYNNFTRVETITTSFQSNATPIKELTKQIKGYSVVIVHLRPFHSAKEKEEVVQYLNDLNSSLKDAYLIVNYYGNPSDLANCTPPDALLNLYEYTPQSLVVAAEVIFGAIGARGKLPVNINAHWALGTGNNTKPLRVLGYGLPEAVGMDSRRFKKIDQIAQEAIETRSTPGCQILVARKGKIVFQKSYGFQTYDSLVPVSNASIYDFASISKVAGTLQSIMFLEDRQSFSLQDEISSHLLDLKNTNKAKMVIGDILTHQAGLWVFIPFWVNTMEEEQYIPEYYANQQEEAFPNQIIQGLYGSPIIQDSVWQWIKESRLRPLSKNKTQYGYRYSDLGFYILHRLANTLLNQPMDEFLEQNLYGPMGMFTLGYQPTCKHPIHQIVPTEVDNYFRRQLVKGFVHDPGAAMTGGVAGHAGLFGRTIDLAKLMQMHLWGGFYGGNRYFREETVKKFSSQYYEDNRRGLGWDKPIHAEAKGPASEYCSSATFGHTGFTGTAVWADPTYDLVYVFLSNRVYPSAENNKLFRLNIRTRIQDELYQSIFDYNRNH